MSVRPRILFPVEDHSVADANNVSGVRRRLQERNVAAGDLLIVTNTYRSANYADHEGKPRDIYDFARKGSTPRVRGKPLVGTGAALHVRLNPTCAGKTLPDKA